MSHGLHIPSAFVCPAACHTTPSPYLPCGSLAPPPHTQVRDSKGLPLDDLPGAVREIASNPKLALAVAIGILSIGFFNFFGLSVTKALSGASRATIDACRTMFVWLFALWAGWETFHGLQVVGFVVLFSGRV